MSGFIGISRRVCLPLLGWLAFGCTETAGAGTGMRAKFFKEVKQAKLESSIDADDAAGVTTALAAGAHVNARGLHDVTPLMLAVDWEKPAAVTALLKAGANPNLKAADGASAVSLAVERYRNAPDIMRAIFAAGGDPNMRRPDKDPVIMRFMNDRDCDAIRYLKSVGADLEVKTRAGDALVSDAAVALDWDVVWCLLELGANPDQENTRLPLTRSLARTVPSPDSPIYPYKVKVWEFMKAKGFAVKPLASPAAK
jgi:hypothetical protein